MEALRSGEALLRHSYGLLPLVVPAVSRTAATTCPRRVARHSTFNRRVIRQPTSRRQFTSVSSLRDSSISSDRITVSKNTDPQDNVRPNSSSAADDLSSVLTALRDSSREQREARAKPSSARTKGELLDSRLEDLLNSMGKPDDAAGGTASKDFLGDGAFDWLGSPDLGRSTARAEIVEKDLPWKLNASTGRRIRLEPDRGLDLARSFRQLDIVCNMNRIKRDAFKQKFHERPGLRRKRLKSERWRRRFKEGFRAIVQKAKAMKKQGW